MIAFYDDNRNGQLDGSETGTFVRMGISQDISCPAGSLEKINQMDSDASGIGVFKDLKQGKYRVTLIGNYGMTNKMNPEVYLSSDQEIVVRFGLTR